MSSRKGITHHLGRLDSKASTNNRLAGTLLLSWFLTFQFLITTTANKRGTDMQWWLAAFNEILSLIPHYNHYSVSDTTDLDEQPHPTINWINGINLPILDFSCYYEMTSHLTFKFNSYNVLDLVHVNLIANAQEHPTGLEQTTLRQTNTILSLIGITTISNIETVDKGRLPK
jgi:hypothetical protein